MATGRPVALAPPESERRLTAQLEELCRDRAADLFLMGRFAESVIYMDAALNYRAELSSWGAHADN